MVGSLEYHFGRTLCAAIDGDGVEAAWALFHLKEKLAGGGRTTIITLARC